MTPSGVDFSFLVRSVLTCIGFTGQILLDFLEGGINDRLGLLLCSHHRGGGSRAGTICLVGFPLALARRALLVLACLAWNLCMAPD